MLQHMFALLWLFSEPLFKVIINPNYSIDKFKKNAWKLDMDSLLDLGSAGWSLYVLPVFTLGSPVSSHPKNMQFRFIGKNKSPLGFIYINHHVIWL